MGDGQIEDIGVGKRRPCELRLDVGVSVGRGLAAQAGCGFVTVPRVRLAVKGCKEMFPGRRHLIDSSLTSCN